MLRFSLIFVFSFALTFYYIVYNPGDSCRKFLAQIGMLETMQESYAIEPESASTPPAPTPEPPSVVALRKSIAQIEEENKEWHSRISQAEKASTTSAAPPMEIEAMNKHIAENEIRITDYQHQIERELKGKGQ
ncbi:MAG: hypothetical protein ACC661_06475 [Verrucomicrobiales bacterium]